MGLKVLVSDAIDVLYEIAQRKRFVSLLHAQLSPLLAMLMSFAQLTAEESEDFEEAGEQLLVSEQDEGPYGLGLRATAAVIVREVVASSDAELRATGLRELMQALSRVINAAAEAQQRAVEGWWRSREAAVFVVGVTLCSEDNVLLQVGEHFQLSSFIQQVVVPDLHVNGTYCPAAINRHSHPAQPTPCCRVVRCGSERAWPQRSLVRCAFPSCSLPRTCSPDHTSPSPSASMPCASCRQCCRARARTRI